MLLRSKPVQQNCVRFYKKKQSKKQKQKQKKKKRKKKEEKQTVRDLRVNETKLTSRNTFIVILFALESKKVSKNEKSTLFWDYPRSLDLSVNLYPPNATYMRFS